MFRSSSKNIPSLTVVARRHLKTLFVGNDANFRLKQKEKDFGIRQPLAPGGAYFVQPELWDKYIKKVASEPEIPETSDCDSSFAALERANTRFSRGYAVNGVGGVVCIRHGTMRPNGIVDLQLGERHVTRTQSS